MNQSADPGLEIVVVPRTADIGGFEVRRALPSARRRLVGPFVFLDQMGPQTFRAGDGLDVRPHPHIGLATVTYLFDGTLTHRDSLGTVQVIRPGAVNWMTAGRGIVHSERTPAEARTGGSLFGIQSWVALPADAEEAEPAFEHHPDAALPVLDDAGVTLRLIAGELFGARSPVRTFQPMFYADALLARGARLQLPPEHEERAVYLVDGGVELDHARHGAGSLLVLRPGSAVTLTAADGPARLMLLGGAPMDGPRHINWNFVSHSRDRISQAREDWKAGRFPPVPGETEYIPLPGDTAGPVYYP